MPGKKKADKKKKKATEVEEDAVDEVATLRNQLEEAEHKLAAERVVVEQLRSINADQAKQLAQAEAILKSETEKHSAEMWVLYDETATAKEQLTHENEILNQRVRQLEAEGQGLRVLESENQTLRDRIGGLMSEVDKASKDHANETHRLKKEVFNLRMQLEQTFRKAIQELDAEYKQRALSNLDEESKNALKANAKLQAELSMQTEGIQAMMDKYKTMESEYTKLKIDFEVLQKAHELQESRIGGLKRAHLVSTSQLEELQTGTVGAGKNKIKELSEACHREREGRAEAEARVAALEKKCEAMERKFEFTVKKLRQQARRRERLTRGGRASSVTGGKPKSAGAELPGLKGEATPEMPPHTLEGYSFPAISAEQSVEAFDAYTDILSIWNANFPGKRGPGAMPSSARRSGRQGHGSGGASGGAAASGPRKQVGLDPLQRETGVSVALLPKGARSLAKQLKQSSPSGAGGHGASGTHRYGKSASTAQLGGPRGAHSMRRSRSTTDAAMRSRR